MHCDSAAEDALVGVSLLTKTVFQPLEIWRMCRPIREQARSHRICVVRYLFGVVMGSESIVLTPRLSTANEARVGVSLLTKTVFHLLEIQRMCRPFREQARSHGICAH
jgi:hypothetical protein